MIECIQHDNDRQLMQTTRNITNLLELLKFIFLNDSL